MPRIKEWSTPQPDHLWFAARHCFADDSPRILPWIDAALTDARSNGFVHVASGRDLAVLDRWSAWCGVHRLPIIHVWEYPHGARVTIDLVFAERQLSRAEMAELWRLWQNRMPSAQALHGLSPLFCHFAGLDPQQAIAFAHEIVRVLCADEIPRNAASAASTTID